MPPRKKVVTGPTPVEDLRHGDTRANIPTGELAGFVAEQAVPPVRCARDPSLDPQLVWRGKDEQDNADLEVPSVPIYVQEKVVPRAIVEDQRRAGSAENDVPSLFDDFDGLEFGDKVDFYAHEANWSNRMILGDSLLAMTSLAEREAEGVKSLETVGGQLLWMWAARLDWLIHAAVGSVGGSGWRCRNLAGLAA